MIAVRLMGGLGNQMFQYSVARKLSSLRQTELCLDMSWFGNQAQSDTGRNYELEDFNIEARNLSFAESLAIYNTGIIGRVSRKLLGPITIYNEQGFKYQKQVMSLPNNSLLIGFYQSEKYFKDTRSQLLKDFSLKDKASAKNKAVLDEIARAKISVSLHVRRGDYVNNKDANKFHGLKGVDYYKAAVEFLEKKIGKDLSLFIFSDDPEWCKKYLKFSHQTFYVDHNTKGVEDMRLMSACEHNVIANSSFSWWGAWLNQNLQKKVIAPKEWFADKTIDTRDIVPSNWERI